MDITLRQEASGDYEQSESVTREAFWNQYAPGCMEHYLLHIMRTCPAFIPELDIVALSQNMVVGHAICLRAVIHADSGREHSVSTLGPLSVLPAYQHRGIGGRMIAEPRTGPKHWGFLPSSCAVIRITTSGRGFFPQRYLVSARRTTCISQRSRPASYRSTRFAAQRGATVRTRSTPWTHPPRWHSTGISRPRLRLTVRLLKSDSRHLLPCTVKQIRNCAQMADLGFSFKNADRRSSEVLYGYLKNQRQPMYPPVAGIGLRRASISAPSEQAAFSYGVPLY